MGLISVIFGAVGWFSLIYYLVLTFSFGFKIAFAEFWLFFAVVLLGCSVLFKKISLGQIRIRKPMIILMGILFCLGIITFVYVEGKILYAGNKVPDRGADYLIVLGAQVRGKEPSQSLKMRIDGALNYLKSNPDTIVIASGGKGNGEDISEAEAIKTTMVEGGALEDRILLEDMSTSTFENLKFSKKLIDNEKTNVVIVTNNFHIMRACMIAEELGYKNVTGYPVKSNPIILLNCYVREFFAVVKDKISGNI